MGRFNLEIFYFVLLKSMGPEPSAHFGIGIRTLVCWVYKMNFCQTETNWQRKLMKMLYLNTSENFLTTDELFKQHVNHVKLF